MFIHLFIHLFTTHQSFTDLSSLHYGRHHGQGTWVTVDKIPSPTPHIWNIRPHCTKQGKHRVQQRVWSPVGSRAGREGPQVEPGVEGGHGHKQCLGTGLPWQVRFELKLSGRAGLQLWGWEPSRQQKQRP